MEKDTGLDLISIIVPVYNTGRRLRACLDSILKQTYPAWELIIVDDGSDDNSPEICDSYKEIDERVKVLHTRNSGVGQARNHGIAIATGAWLCFIDSDDWCEPWYIRSFAEHINDRTDIIMQGFIKEKDGMEIRRKQLAEDFYQDIPHCFLQNDLINFGSPCCKLFRRSLLEEHGLLFPSEYNYGEDTVFFFRYIACCNSVTCLGKEGYHYVEHSLSSLSNRVHESLPLLLFIKESSEQLQRWLSGNDESEILKKHNVKSVALANKAFNNMYILKYREPEKRTIISFFQQSVRPLLNAKGLSLHERVFLGLTSLPVNCQLLMLNLLAGTSVIKTGA